jgi:outer membrane murein-binding lipoprotein Lpp
MIYPKVELFLGRPNLIALYNILLEYKLMIKDLTHGIHYMNNKNTLKIILAILSISLLSGCNSQLGSRAELENRIDELEEENIAIQQEAEEAVEAAQEDVEKAERIWERDQSKK